MCPEVVVKVCVVPTRLSVVKMSFLEEDSITLPDKGVKGGTDPSQIADYRRRIYGPWIDLAAGSMGGAACLLAGQPLDTVKTRLQVNPGVYRTVPTCIKKSFIEGGIRTFYYGSLPALLTHTSENAALFLFYNQCQSLIQKCVGARSEKDLTVYHRGLAGSLASVFTSLFIGPLEMLKCRLQIRHDRRYIRTSVRIPVYPLLY